MKSFIKFAVLALCLASILVLIAGCSKRSEQTGMTTGDAPSNITPKPVGPKVAGIVFQEDQYFKMVEYGMKTTAEKYGIELKLQNTANSQDKEVNFIDTYIADKVAAICIAPLSAKASIAPLKRAHEAGIKIVTFDSSIDADFPVSSIKSDQVDLGRNTGIACREYIKSKLNGKAKIAILQYKSLLPEPSGQRVKGFLDEVKQLPGVKIVANQDAWEAAPATDKATSIITANPDVNIIWSANEGGTVGSVMAVKNAGKAGKIVVFGTDMSEQLANFLTDSENILQAVTAQKPLEIGRAAIENVMKAIKGEKVEKKIALKGILYTRQDTKAIDEFKKMVKDIK